MIYIIGVFFIGIIGAIFLYTSKTKKKASANIRLEPRIHSEVKLEQEEPESEPVSDSVYDPKVIVLQIRSSSGKPYIGYELLQTLLSVGLVFGEDGIFHRDEFSVAAATKEGVFPYDDMGSFKCYGLVAFLKIDPNKKKLMESFDLMLDTARQLVEDLGGEIHDEQNLVINAAVIKKLREKICTVETNNLYASDLLDNLD